MRPDNRPASAEPIPPQAHPTTEETTPQQHADLLDALATRWWSSIDAMDVEALKAGASALWSHEALLEAVDTWKRVAYGHGEDAHRLAAELVESESQRAALVEALRNLMVACAKADSVEELPPQIDGSLLDAARTALESCGAWNRAALQKAGVTK